MKSVLALIKSLPKMVEEKRVFFAIIDGLGKVNLGLKNFSKEIYRTVFPSSTPTFLYSFHSLKEPREHGFLEWYMRFRNTIVSIPPWVTVEGKALELGKEIERKDVFPFISLSEMLYRKGFTSVCYTPYPNSAFTKVTNLKGEIVGINFLSEVFPLKHADFTFIYWPSVDMILHKRHIDEALKAEITLIKTFLKILAKKMPANSVLFVLGDHGLTKCEKRYLLPEIESCIPVGGERVAFYRGLEKEAVEEAIRKRKIPAYVYYLDEIEGFKNGANRRCYENFGEIAVVAKEKVCFSFPFEKKEKCNLASHGGLSKEERFVNVWRFEK